MTSPFIDLRDARPAHKAGAVHCFSCHRNVNLQEVFDGWELGHSRDECPYCDGLLLAPLQRA